MAAPGRGFEKGLNMASADKVPMLQEGFDQLTEELKRLLGPTPGNGAVAPAMTGGG